jgi:tetratricopeptide (TPR) repeat protein
MFDVPENRTALLNRAEELLLRALQQKPQSGPAYYFLGLAKKARGDLDGALETFTKTIEINPSHAPAYANVGHVLIRMGRYDEGLDQVRYAIRLSPKDPALAGWQTFGGEAEIARGNDDAAVEWLTRAVTLSPRRIHARALLAAVYALMGNAEASTQQVAELKKLTPGVEGASRLLTIVGVKKLSPRVGEGLRLALDHSS